MDGDSNHVPEELFVITSALTELSTRIEQLQCVHETDMRMATNELVLKNRQLVECTDKIKLVLTHLSSPRSQNEIATQERQDEPGPGAEQTRGQPSHKATPAPNSATVHGLEALSADFSSIIPSSPDAALPPQSRYSLISANVASARSSGISMGDSHNSAALPSAVAFTDIASHGLEEEKEATAQDETVGGHAIVGSRRIEARTFFESEASIVAVQEMPEKSGQESASDEGADQRSRSNGTDAAKRGASFRSRTGLDGFALRQLWAQVPPDTLEGIASRFCVTVSEHVETDTTQPGSASSYFAAKRAPSSKRASTQSVSGGVKVRGSAISACALGPKSPRASALGVTMKRLSLMSGVSRRSLENRGSSNSLGFRCPCLKVMSPMGYPRLLWNALSLLIILYDVYMIPMQAFSVGDRAEFKMVEWMATFFWSFDVLLNFRTGFYIGSHLEMRPGRIAVKYAKTWLAVDLFIVVLEWLNRAAGVIGSAALLRGSRAFRAIRFMKLLRLAKIKELWSKFSEQINSNVTHLCITLTVLCCFLLTVIHIVACLWYAIGDSRSDGWISYDTYSGAKDTLFWYIASARWVISQLNGRTDMHEDRNMQERLFTCIVGVSLAVFAQAMFIGFITKTTLDLGEIVAEKTGRHRLVNNYLEKFCVSTDLKVSIKRYMAEYRDSAKVQEQESTILSFLPNYVQTQLLFEVRKSVLMPHPLFSNLNTEFQWFTRLLCRQVVKLATAMKYEVVFDKGDACSGMLFMDKVRGRYVNEQNAFMQSGGQPLQMQAVKSNMALTILGTDPSSLVHSGLGVRIKAGTWICEPALWLEWINKGRLVAATHGHMFRIDSAELADGLQSQPEVLALTVLYARAVVAELKSMDINTDCPALDVDFSEVCPFHVCISVNSAYGLQNADGALPGMSAPYCVCKAQNFDISRFKTVFTTDHTSNGSLNPMWNHSSFISLSEDQSLLFEIWDSPPTEQLLGQVCLEPDSFLPFGFEGDVRLEGGVSRKTYKGSLSVKVEVLDTPLQSETESSRYMSA